MTYKLKKIKGFKISDNGNYKVIALSKKILLFTKINPVNIIIL